jgi:hypothetical protein
MIRLHIAEEAEAHSFVRRARKAQRIRGTMRSEIER